MSVSLKKGAIGNYIHLTSQGYSYGLVPRTLDDTVFTKTAAKEQKSTKATGVFQRHQSMIQGMVAAKGNDIEAEKIQNTINNFTSLLQSSNQSDKDFYQKIIELTANEIKAELDSICLNVKPLKGSLDEDIARAKEIAKRMYDSSTGSSKQVYLNGATVAEFINRMGRILNRIENGVLNINDIKNINQSEQEIKNFTQSIRETLDIINKRTGKRLYLRNANGEIKNSRGSGGVMKYQKSAFMITDPDTGKQTSIIEFAKMLSEELLDYLSWNSAEKKGKAAELFLSAISAYSKGVAGTSAEQVFKTGKDKMWVGQKGGNVVYLNENFIPGFKINDSSYKEIKIGKKSGLKARGVSPDKVDAIFYYDEVRSAKISIKNYAEYIVKTRGFSGVSGASFLSLIQWFEPSFVNHWINATIQHADMFSYDYQRPGDKPLNIYDAHKIMLGSLVVLGALGGTQRLYNGQLRGQDQPDYLVWNNNSATGGAPDIKVYAMSTLLKNCLDTITIHNSSKWVEGYDYFLSNEWSTINFYNEIKKMKEDPSEEMKLRIINLLSKLHQIKISTHFFLPSNLPAMF